MVSICLVTYNGEKYILEQITSILIQLSQDDEIIISDDSSTDSTIEAIKAINDKRIHIFHHIPNSHMQNMKLGGYRLVAENYQNALKRCHGDYIFLSDQDDVWVPGRLEKMLNALKKNTIVLCNYTIIDSNGNETGRIGYRENEKPVTNSYFYNVFKSRFMCCCMGFRREVMNYILPFPKKLMSCDQWIGDISTLIGNCKYLNEPLHKYRRHDQNVSETSGKSKNSLSLKIYFRLYILFITLIRFFRVKIYRRIYVII